MRAAKTVAYFGERTKVVHTSTRKFSAELQHVALAVSFITYLQHATEVLYLPRH